MEIADLYFVGGFGVMGWVAAETTCKPANTLASSRSGIAVVLIHVLDDARRRLASGFGLGLQVVLGGDPAHHAESADEIGSAISMRLERKSSKVHPIPRVLMPRQDRTREWRAHRRRRPGKSPHQSLLAPLPADGGVGLGN